MALSNTHDVMVTGEMGGSVELDYLPEGLFCVIRAPTSDRIRRLSQQEEVA